MDMDKPLHTAAALDWEPRPSERRDDFRRSLVTVVAVGTFAVIAGIVALAILHVGLTAGTVALCAAPLAAGLGVFLVLAPIESRRHG